MLTLTRRRRSSIYILRAKEGGMKGYMGFGPEAAHTRAADVWSLSVFRSLAEVRTSSRARTSANFVL